MNKPVKSKSKTEAEKQAARDLERAIKRADQMLVRLYNQARKEGRVA